MRESSTPFLLYLLQIRINMNKTFFSPLYADVRQSLDYEPFLWFMDKFAQFFKIH